MTRSLGPKCISFIAPRMAFRFFESSLRNRNASRIASSRRFICSLVFKKKGGGRSGPVEGEIDSAETETLRPKAEGGGPRKPLLRPRFDFFLTSGVVD